MNKVLFNLHDLVLMMTALQCLLFAVLLVVTNTYKFTSTYFLAAFLLAHTFIPLNEMSLWGEAFKFTARAHWPTMYFFGGYAYYLDALLLYFCVKSLLLRDFQLRWRDLWHLLPLCVYALFMWQVYYRLSFAQRLWLIDSETFVYSASYIVADVACKWLRVGYIVACLVILARYKKLLKSTHSNIEKVETHWITVVVIGFGGVMSLELLLSLAKMMSFLENPNVQIFETLGLIGYYALFILVNLLVYTGIRHFASFTSVGKKPPINATLSDQLLNPELARAIDQKMRDDKLYRPTDITLDHLADALDVSSRDLSMIINRHFSVNFYEFINRYRVAEAQQLLRSSEKRDRTITDIYLAVGFNSKSVFNTFFKKIVGVTPSQYRKEGDGAANKVRP